MRFDWPSVPSQLKQVIDLSVRVVARWTPRNAKKLRQRERGEMIPNRFLSVRKRVDSFGWMRDVSSGGIWEKKLRLLQNEP